MLSSIQQKFQSKIFKKYSVFFAFSNDQYQRGLNRELGDVVSAGAGMYIPTMCVKTVLTQLEQINRKCIFKVLATKSKKDIIWYSLGNFEAQITNDITDTVEDVAKYGFNEQDVLDQYPDYYNHCIENDYF